MTNTLKPCPFCGGEAEIVDVCNDCFISGKVGVGCSKCPVIIAEYGEYKVFDSEAEAIAAWNTRACDECERGAIPATEGNMREHGLVRERTCRDEFNGKAWCFKCNACGCVIPWKDSFNNESIRGGLLHYCPNCGAKVIDKVVEE